MDRAEVIQSLLDLYPSPSYLEIGVNFHAVRAARKVAVDPVFNFNLDQLEPHQNKIGAEYHLLPSDEYFYRVMTPADRFDVIFLDGLHTFDQTLRDLLNAIECVREGGVIVIDDVIPSAYSASLSDLDTFFAFREAAALQEHAWMGDVYRLIFFLRDYLPAFSYATVQENHGQTILWRARRPGQAAPAGVRGIAELDYAHAMIGKAAFDLQPFTAIHAKIAAYVGSTARP